MDESTQRSRHPDSMRQACLWALLPMLVLFLIAPSVSDAQVVVTTNITQTTGAGNLGTQVLPPSGNVYGITGGKTLGTNLFHSFGEFSVGAGDIAQFQTSNLIANPSMSNILGRVTGGNPSNIFGAIDSATFYPGANLFLMNPFGIVFGPNASLNVGGSVSFTNAQYIRLFDGISSANFYADPAHDGLANSILTIDSSAFTFLSASPAAYGFLTAPDPSATITVQGSALSVPSGQSISFVGGNVVIQGATLPDGTVQPAHLSAPNGTIQLASTASPGEFDVATLTSLPNMNGTSFTSFGSTVLAPGSSIDVSGARTVFIKGGQLVLSVNDAVLTTLTTSQTPGLPETISLSPGSSIMTSNSGTDPGADIQLIASNVQMDGASMVSATMGDGPGGNVTIQGRTGAGSAADSVTLTNGAAIISEAFASGRGGDILITSDAVQLDSVQYDIRAGISSATSNDFVAGVVGGGGDISLNVSTLTLMGLSFIRTQTGTLFRPGFGQGGNVTIQGLQGAGSAAESVTLTNGASINSEANSSGRGGDILITSDAVQLDTGPSINSNTSSGATGGGDISLNVSTLTLMGSSYITTNTGPFSAGFDQGGNVTIQGLQGAGSAAESVSLSGNSGLVSQAYGGRIGARVAITSKSVAMDGGSVITAVTSGFGRGIDIVVGVRQLSLSGGATIRSSTLLSDPSLETGGAITVQGLQGAGSAAESVSLSGGSRLVSETTGSEVGSNDGGAIVVHAKTVSLTDEAVIQAGDVFSIGGAGKVTIDADSVGISGGSRISSNSGLLTAGQVTITANALTLDNGSIVTQTAGDGPGGDVVLNVRSSVSLSNGATIDSSTSRTGRAGDVTITAQTLALANGGQIRANTVGTGPAGDITLNVDTLTTAGFFSGIFSKSNSADSTAGNAGSITIQGITGSGSPAANVSLDSGTISTTIAGGTLSNVPANITIAAQSVTLSNGVAITASTTGNAPAGNIELVTQQLTMTPDSAITSNAQTGGAGTAGSITITGAGSAPTTIAGGTIQAQSETSASAGDITLHAPGDLTLLGTTVSVKNTGPGDAGSINLRAGNDLLVRNSQVSTESAEASGGNIKLTAPNLVRIVDSTLTSSVQGQAGSNGGNIDIDPQFVVIQNSQLLANANAGAGGNITITATGAVLIDPNSLLSASAGPAGISGSVNINSPIKVLSGALMPLNLAYSQAALSGDRCAADPTGQFSSFVQTGRDGVPQVPGALSPSPLSFLETLTSGSLGSQSPNWAAMRLGLDSVSFDDSTLFRFHSACRS